MLTESDYLELLQKEPEEVFFYYDRPILYRASHQGNDYLISLLDDEGQTDRFLVVQYSEPIYSLLQESRIIPREFFIHSDNAVHEVLIGYSEDRKPALLLGTQYEDNLTIPDDYLPTVEARWTKNP
jgi:hypothetical protein